MTSLFTPENAIVVAKIGLLALAIVGLLRVFLGKDDRHKLLDTFTHFLRDSKSPTAHKIYHFIHRELPPFSH